MYVKVVLSSANIVLAPQTPIVQITSQAHRIKGGCAYARFIPRIENARKLVCNWLGSSADDSYACRVWSGTSRSIWHCNGWPGCAHPISYSYCHSGQYRRHDCRQFECQRSLCISLAASCELLHLHFCRSIQDV